MPITRYNASYRAVLKSPGELMRKLDVSELREGRELVARIMDHPDRFPHTHLDICQQDDIDILVGVVTNHRAHTSVDTLFLREQDFPGVINSEAHPISPPPISVYRIP